MKKRILLLTLSALLFSSFAHTQDTLADVFPLLLPKTQTAAQNLQVLNVFYSAKEPDTIFATGASLVRIPPAKAYENRLLNLIIKDDNMLKKVFASVILTAMGTQHEELSPLLKDATASQDRALRSYAAAAYTILNPQNDIYKSEIVNLYIYEPAFALRAMNLISKDEKQTLKYLKEAAKDDIAQVRAAAVTWLGDMQNKQAAQQLLKMAKKESDQQVVKALAIALAQNKEWTLQDCAKALNTRHTAPSAATYALALGFMTGNAMESVKQGLLSTDRNTRINSARAAAYMAAVLSSPQASQYTNDKAFDIALLKSFIPLLSAMEQKDETAVKVYADNALKQISKLM